MMNTADSVRSWFAGRQVVIATRHRKEAVLAPLLESELGLRPFVMEDFDTDRFGTFSGEIERVHDAVTTLRLKCAAAMDQSGCDLAVASEGSYGAHPVLWMLPAAEEWVMISDRKNHLEVVEHELSTDTNYAMATVGSVEALEKFAAKVKFPSHGLILRKGNGPGASLVKGITDRDQLMNSFKDLEADDGDVQVETDMRAVYNPTRMRVIKKAAEKLLAKLHNCCPRCATPGFGITGAVKGRPCSRCHTPTASLLAYEQECPRCAYKERMPLHDGLPEDPMYCEICNP